MIDDEHIIHENIARGEAGGDDIAGIDVRCRYVSSNDETTLDIELTLGYIRADGNI